MEPLPLDVLGEFIHSLSVKTIGKMTLLCRLVAPQFIWRQIKLIDFNLGDEYVDDWAAALPRIQAAKAQIETLFWHHAASNAVARWRPLQGPSFQASFPPNVIISISKILQTVRTISIGACDQGDTSAHAFNTLISNINPKIIEEITIDCKVSGQPLLKLFEQQCPKLRKLRLKLDGSPALAGLITVISAGCPNLKEFYFDSFGSRYLLDASTVELSTLFAALRTLGPRLHVLGLRCGAVQQLGSVMKNIKDKDWRGANAEVSRLLNLNLSKLQVDGYSLWGQQLVSLGFHLSSDAMNLALSVCHPDGTPDALYNIGSALAAHRAMNDLDINFFLVELQRWAMRFASHDIYERPLLPGWYWYCFAVGHLFHITPQETLDLLAICPSVVEVITITRLSRKGFSSSAVSSLIRDTAWWKKNTKDINKLENPGLHSMHYLAWSGMVVESMLASPSLKWEEDRTMLHWFASLLQNRHLCEFDVPTYDSCLAAALETLKQKRIRPLRFPLSEFEMTTLSKLGPLKQLLAQLACDEQVILSAASILSPEDMLEAMESFHDTGYLDSSTVERAATAYWKQILCGKPPSIFNGERATIAEYLKRVLRAWPAVPPLVFDRLVNNKSVSTGVRLALQMLASSLKQKRIRIERKSEAVFV